jgi:hypothetical protein
VSRDTPWSPLVTQADVDLFFNENPGGCPHCAAPLGDEHRSAAGVECWILRNRRNRRHGWIAYIHVRAKAPDTPAEIATRMLALRDELIRQLQDHLDYDRAGLIEWIRHQEAERAAIDAHRRAA